MIKKTIEDITLEDLTPITRKAGVIDKGFLDSKYNNYDNIIESIKIDYIVNNKTKIFILHGQASILLDFTTKTAYKYYESAYNDFLLKYYQDTHNIDFFIVDKIPVKTIRLKTHRPRYTQKDKTIDFLNDIELVA